MIVSAVALKAVLNVLVLQIQQKPGEVMVPGNCGSPQSVDCFLFAAITQKKNLCIREEFKALADSWERRKPTFFVRAGSPHV